ncbi:PhoX family protein [Rhodospirillaceae bacterium SYSU D60014]|uniref:PhoX family protein n=1 Tax=Virgifigura deserti TaxID=2268457 RepID=UPI000E665179
MRLSQRYAPIVVRDSDDIGSNPTDARPMIEIVEARLSRRGLLKGVAGSAVASAFGSSMFGCATLVPGNPSTLTFEEIARGIDETHHVAPGYAAEVLIRWGDKVVKDAPAFDPRNQSAGAQARQFGYNCDFIAYMPLPVGSRNSENGLLCVNHEYTSAELMFPGLTEKNKLDRTDKYRTEIELAAHGHSVVEIRKHGNGWRVVEDSPYNRRVSLSGTKMRVAGPAAGHARLRTSADLTGREVIGTANNCGGGWTPWGTVLIAEENFDGYFGGRTEGLPQAAAYKRYGISGDSQYAWWKFHDRFNLEKEPNEPNRFGWIVEIDPYDPESVPVKRTALGRFKHENAHAILNKDGRVVVYMGDDERFDYVYKFVTSGLYDSDDRAANMNLLDKGTLYVARFHDDGRMEWLPIVHGEDPLTPENGFGDHGDVMIEVRRAADLLGATPMDRPEFVVPNPVNGRVYAMLTNNSKRGLDQIDAVNPRANNTTGHILETIPPGDGAEADHAATDGRWEIFLLAGDPTFGTTQYGDGTSDKGWFACPDGCTFDSKGRLWIATDQGGAQAEFGIGDGIWATDTGGDGRAVTRAFFRIPIGAEACGPCFTPDDKTLFVSVQHPGADGLSSFDRPSTRWPDFADGIPPRPSVVAITKLDGGEIGS